MGAGAGAGLTVMVTSLLLDRIPSDAVNRNAYVPEVEKLAVVLRALMLTKVTVPGPLNFDHVVVNVCEGRPSSVAVPFRLADEGSVIV